MVDVSDPWHICGELEQGRRQIVLVFQGGGALGAYQAGVYQALHEAGVDPDWIIGTSIGAINASLIAGDEPEIGSVGWETGYADTTRALQRAAWNDDCDPLEGVILHEPETAMVPAAE
jgi:hypothetical protein